MTTATHSTLVPAGLPGLVVDEASDETGRRAAAVFNTARTYRYLLTRIWDPSLPPTVFLMLNPSTADSLADDPTIRRCTSFALREGAGCLVVANLFALRATNPARLRQHQNPVGEHNDVFIRHATSSPGPVIAAWGAAGALLDRAESVLTTLRGAGVTLHCLGVTSAGQPRHPLYLPKVAPLVPYEGGAL